MEDNEIKILQEYFDYRKNTNDRDEEIDNIFLNEIYWPDSDGNRCFLFKNFEDIKKFFNNCDIKKKMLDNVPKIWGGKGESYCGTMIRNASICDSINEVIYTKIYEVLKKRMDK